MMTTDVTDDTKSGLEDKGVYDAVDKASHYRSCLSHTDEWSLAVIY